MYEILMQLIMDGQSRSLLLLRQHFGIVRELMLISMIQRLVDVQIVLMLIHSRDNLLSTRLVLLLQLVHVQEH
jgi:hypothetical protein